ncbi:uncharacterized protein LOC132794489 [Drosophila nasuta]|uniref:uncharacterized protein LOC132794489 n=1 Tax=Drosophila nasuta TaxID=42062 RepID=UPI00295F3BBD|nr:uncharacterized protein LOC132794489 [Drosophila nasuta]
MRATTVGILSLCLVIGLSAGIVVPNGGHFAAPFVPTTDLAQELMEIYSLIQFKPINQLLVRYLINDAQFQAFVRILNSNGGFTARWRLRSQPEIVMFLQWVNQQLALSRGKFELEDMEMCVTLVNRYPYWSGTVSGWAGFLSELEMYFPQYAIQAHIQAKLQLPGIFAEFWSRLQALQVIYERWLAMPSTQAVVNELQAAGIDQIHLDTLIRNLFGWNTINGTTTAAPGTPSIIPTVAPGAVMPPGLIL